MESFLRPKNIYIGDEAELVIKLSDIIIDTKLFSETSLKNKTYETENFSILNLEVIELNSEKFLSIRFKAWAVGSLNFPSLEDFGIMSRLPVVEVQALLEEDASLVLIEDASAILIPGTSFLFLGIAFGSIFFLIVFFIFCRKIFGKKKIKNKKKILKKFKQNIKKVFKKKNIDGKDLCYEVEKILRNFFLYFFESFEGKNILSLTYSEILDCLKKDLDNTKIIFELEKIFRIIEQVRFNNYNLEKEVFLKEVNNFSSACFDFYLEEKRKKEKINA